MPNGRHGQHPAPAGGGPRGGGGVIRFEIPRRAVPGYVTAIMGDHHTLHSRNAWKDVPPGHRFQLYFHGMSDKGEIEKPEDRAVRRRLDTAAGGGDWDMLTRNGARPSGEWLPLKNQKRVALAATAGMGSVAADLLTALAERAKALQRTEDWHRDAELIAPLATGLGNPHPVENGFAFLPPYGVPYLAGSGVKGVLRRAAEELAVFDAESPWSLAHVWALFGFDEDSACFKDDEHAREWQNAYATWAQLLRERGDALLDAWLDAIRNQLPPESRALAPAEFIEALPKSQPLRRAIHWQGLLAVQDAFPDAKATMAVDILNPHHKSYYEGNGAPHDAENPVPVFFLTVAPGARFAFAARAVRGRDAIWETIGDWKALLDAAFDHARDWLGFGAKTVVGYGAMAEPDASPAAPQKGDEPGGGSKSKPTPTETRWEKARLKFNQSNGTLEASDGKGHSAYAYKPRGAELLGALPADLQRKLKNGQPVHVSATVRGRNLLMIEPLPSA
jgi:CRISPR-associated protein Cmr6